MIRFAIGNNGGKSKYFCDSWHAKCVSAHGSRACSWRVFRSMVIIFLISHISSLISSCARMGNPDGGWYDETPPYVTSASPEDKAIGVKTKKIVINFNEYIKIEDAQNKVIVSPPQIEQAEIKAAGKRIIIELKDSLKDNTTYSVDFSDAITDNNEGNPLGNYTYTFSTGTEIDTFEVAGYVLQAENLEPVKGILVGLYDDLSDTVFKSKPMIRISRTDSRGHFVIKGVAPGTYRTYALQDSDGDFVYNQKSEMLAFSHETFEPSSMPDTRQDTLWRDTLHIENIIRVPYTHFLPDDVTLLAFTAVQTDRHLLKTERKEPNKFSFYFTYGDSLLPVLRGLNFDADSAFVIEATEKLDTIHYWLRDTLLVNQDTLRMEVQYNATDTAGLLVQNTDTLEVLAKVPYEKRLKERLKEFEKWQKEQEKKKKRGQPYDSIMPPMHLSIKLNGVGSMAPDQNITLESPEPLLRCDTAGIHLYSKIDTLWYRVPYIFRQKANTLRSYELLAEWKPGVEYSIEIDSAAIESIYGIVNPPIKAGAKVKQLEEFSTLLVNVSGIRDTSIVVQMLNKSEAIVKQTRVGSDGTAEFFYVRPGEYYLRAFVDRNGNGKWDTGDYDTDQQPEDVYYYSEVTECKEKWDVTRDWNLTAKKRFRQKPGEITKQKADKEKKQKSRNLDRAKQLGVKYIREATGVNL